MTLTGPLRARARSASAALPAMLVAEGLRPALLPDGIDAIRDGWICLTTGLGAAVNFGALPLPVTRDGVLAAEIVEIEQRGDDWWGRVEVRGENETAKMLERFDDAMLGMHVSRVSVRPDGVNVERVEPLDHRAVFPPLRYETSAPPIPGDRKVVRFDSERGWSEETIRRAEVIRSPREEPKARAFEPAWVKQKPEPRGPNRHERRAAQARARSKR